MAGSPPCLFAAPSTLPFSRLPPLHLTTTLRANQPIPLPFPSNTTTTTARPTQSQSTPTYLPTPPISKTTTSTKPTSSHGIKITHLFSMRSDQSIAPSKSLTSLGSNSRMDGHSKQGFHPRDSLVEKAWHFDHCTLRAGFTLW